MEFKLEKFEVAALLNHIFELGIDPEQATPVLVNEALLGKYTWVEPLVEQMVPKLIRGLLELAEVSYSNSRNAFTLGFGISEPDGQHGVFNGKKDFTERILQLLHERVLEAGKMEFNYDDLDQQGYTLITLPKKEYEVFKSWGKNYKSVECIQNEVGQMIKTDLGNEVGQMIKNDLGDLK